LGVSQQIRNRGLAISVDPEELDHVIEGLNEIISS
jgi:hypothetical protein